LNLDAANAIRTLRDRGEQLDIVPQNLIEFWNVYTRQTEQNGIIPCIHGIMLQNTLSLIGIETVEAY
jgi:hypothetical protein